MVEFRVQMPFLYLIINLHFILRILQCQMGNYAYLDQKE
jgi:hypothetical protein